MLNISDLQEKRFIVAYSMTRMCCTGNIWANYKLD